MDSAGSGGAGPRRSFRRACSAFFRRLASRLLQPTPPPWDDVNNQSPSPGPTPRPSPAPHQPPAPLPRAPQSHIDATRRRCGSPTQHPWQGQQAPQTVHDNIRVPGQHPRIHEDKNRGLGADLGGRSPTGSGATRRDGDSGQGVRQQQPPVVEAEADYVVVLPAKPTDFNSNVTEMMRRQGEFLVHVRSERGAALRVAAGEHVLSVHAEGLTLLTLAERRALCTWPYTLTAKFGRATGVFSLVAGSRCESGPGLFSFETQDVNQVFDLVFRYIGLALPSTATPGPPCPRPPLDPQSPRGDGAEDSDDSSYDYAYCDVPEGAHAGT
ncbi:unnamed protein product [Lampetra fluviatilis]